MLSVGAATEPLPSLDVPGIGPSVEVAGLADNSPSVAETHSSAFARFSSADELAQHLIDDALERYANQFGQPGTPWWNRLILCGEGGLSVDSIAVETAGHSETNTQVAGVDEGDVVKTDGEYLYVLADQEVVILDARVGEDLRVASRVEIPGRPFAQYLNGDRLTVLSRLSYGPLYMNSPPDLTFAPTSPPRADSVQVAGLSTNVGVWPGYCPPPSVAVTIIDVSDGEAPAVVQRTELEGSYIDSRAIGNSVYLVLSDTMQLPGPQLIPVPQAPKDTAASPQPSDSAHDSAPLRLVDSYAYPIYGGGDYVYETREQYLERISGKVLDLALPHFSSFGPDGDLLESGLLSQPTDVYRPLSADTNHLVSIVAFDMASNEPGPTSSTSVPTDWASEVYVSMDSLYLLSPVWTDGCTQTSILKFDLPAAGDGVELSGMGSVPGTVLNQFSVDEYAGHLRIATTGGRAGRWDGQGNSQNNLYVLQQQSESLEIVGRLEDLAPGETIYSARFLGDRAFLVTYRKVDPLFAIDLSDPTDPHVEGELKIPGFSNYLHAINDTYLMGIGRNADENTGLFQDPQVSLFNVGQLAEPELLARYTIDTGRTGGMNLFYDHHVIAYHPEYRVLTISAPGQYENHSYVNGLWVFRIHVAPQAGSGDIELLGQIQHGTSVSRALRIGDVLYTVSKDTVSAHDILDPESQIAELYFGVNQLGRIDFVEQNGLDLSGQDHWYHFRTAYDGILTAETLSDHTADRDARLTLYDAQLNELASSADALGWNWSQERVQWQTGADTPYYLKVSGAAEDVDLRLGNLVEIREEGPSNTAYLHGTSGDDTLVVEAYRREGDGEDSRAEDDHGVTQELRYVLVVNGVRHDFDARLVSQVHFDGHAGYDTVSVRLGGWDRVTTAAELSPGSATMTISGVCDTEFQYGIDLANVSSITVRGGNGADTHGSAHQGNVAYLHGSAFGDAFVTTPRYGGMSGPGYSNCVLGFNSVFAYAEPVNGAPLTDWYLTVEQNTDVAKFYDSPGDDTYVTTPRYAGLHGDGFERHAIGFNEAHAFATAGGSDRAKMYDSPGDDTFYADPVQGSLYGQGFFNRAKFFEQVHAFATAGGYDVANLFGSAGDDSFYSDPVQAALWGDGFYNRGKHFEEVDARATGGGNDRAYLHDSSQSDHLEAHGHSAQLTSVDLSFLCRIADFDRVRAVSHTGGDTKRIAAVDFSLTLDGQWTDE